MTEILFHCTFSDRDITGHLHRYNGPYNTMEYVYGACIMLVTNNACKVTGGIIVQTDYYDTNEGFTDMLIQAFQKCPHLLPLLKQPFTLQPFKIPVLNTELPLEENAYYELLFEKYFTLSHQGTLPN